MCFLAGFQHIISYIISFIIVRKIIIVDDDTSILESFKTILDSEGYETHTAIGGGGLAMYLANFIPDLILLDYGLPNENGGVITKKIRKNLKTAHIPIIIISANDQFRAIAKLAGANEFIEKPIEINSLLSTIKRLLT